MKEIRLEIFSKDKYIIEEKELTRVLSYIKSREKRIDKAIHFLKTEYNSYPSSEEWCKALIKILNGDDK